jgi:hypothetical protein
VEVLEAQLLEFAEQGVQAEAVRDRRVDLERLARDPPALLRIDRVERAHVVQPVRELDQHDAHVARHRQQHLAEVLRLRLLGRGELQLVELGDAVDQVGDHGAEALDQLLLGDAGVLEDVVQQRGLDRGAVEPPVREDLGDRERVRDVRGAAAAELPQVSLVGEAERVLDLLHVARRQVLLDAVGQRGDGRYAVVRFLGGFRAPDGLLQRFGRTACETRLRKRRVRRGGRRISGPHMGAPSLG